MASAGLFSEIWIFGDSLSDTGNVLEATDAVSDPIPVSPPYFNGRFSNGSVWVEVLAESLGFDAEAFLTGGTNFAFGGAEIEADTEDLFEQDIGVTIPSIRTQVRTFLFEGLFDIFDLDEVDPAALYVLWGGANDIRDALMTETDPFAEAQEAVEELAAAIEDLSDQGAIYFLVPNLPDLGLTPESRARGEDEVARATAVSRAFNTALTAALDTLEAQHNIVITRLETFDRLREAVANPAAFGFTNVSEPCLDGDPFTGGTPCANPTEYLFWDTIHPTTAAHATLAECHTGRRQPGVSGRLWI
jgi:outer membrane lipase/esterase